MRFITITIFSVTSSLAAFAIAKPVPNCNLKAGGMAIPLARKSSSLNSQSIDIDAIRSHGIHVSVREKILGGLNNYETNTGTMHPFTVNRSESGIERRGASFPLTIGQYHAMWTGSISIGTPPKTLEVHIDTGASDLWVLQTGCSGINLDRDLYDPYLSDSAEYTAKSFQLKYLDGSVVTGERYTDNITISGFTADPQTFGSVTSYTSRLPNNRYTDGSLGLAFSSISNLYSDPLFVSLVRQRRLINPTFSLKLSSSGAEMYIGGTNSMLYKGDITYTRVTNPGFCQVSMDDVRVNGNTVLKNIPAIFDTGSNYIFGDSKLVSELYRGLDGTLVEFTDFNFYHLPCKSFPTLSLTFGGRTFKIPPDIFRLHPISEGSPNCYCAIISERSPIAYWTIGIPFLQGVYSVFDYTDLKVGFADLS